MTLVVDASVVVAALVDGGPNGQWAEKLLVANPLAAPHLVQVEVAHVLRRAAHTEKISHDVATLAHNDLLDVGFELYPYAPFADRIWELRGNVTSYDAWYVALAEELGCPLATLDSKLTNTPGVRCTFEVPPSAPPDGS